MQDDKNAIFQMRFPQKLWYLLNLRTDAILWGGTGRTILLNYRILHNYLQCDNSIFKTANISSFVRQLNLYGFRKVTSHLQDPLCNSSNPYMHEYIHDYFQYGRPELLNKITRKALTLKRSTKPKSIFNSNDQIAFITPLEKARRALRIALKKTAQDLLIKSSPKQMSNVTHEFEDVQDHFCEEEENITVDWLIPNSENKEGQTAQDLTENVQENKYVIVGDRYQNNGDTSQDSVMSFSDDSCQQNVDGFPGQFLNMPDLDPEPSEGSGVELLAEFNIEDENEHGIATANAESKVNDHQFLNCVLPSISNDHNDDVTMTEGSDISVHINEIIEKWESCKPKEEILKPVADVDVQLAKLLESQSLATTTRREYTDEEKKIREAILSQYSQLSDNEEAQEKEEVVDSNDLVKNTNALDVAAAARERREQARLEAQRKKEKDREDREKQKQLKEEKKEKRKTQKGERKR